MALETYVVDTLTTRDVTLRERTDFWSEHVTSYQSRMGYMYPRTDDFHAGTIRQCTDTYQLVMFWSDTIKYTRTAGQARRDPDEDYRLLLPVAGEMVLRQDDREVRLVPGAGCLISFATPFEILQEASMRALIMSIAAQEVNGRLNRSSPLTAGLDLTSGLGRVVGGMLTGLHEERDTLTSGQFDAVSDRLVELLCMLAAGEDRPPPRAIWPMWRRWSAGTSASMRPTLIWSASPWRRRWVGRCARCSWPCNMPGRPPAS